MVIGVSVLVHHALNVLYCQQESVQMYQFLFSIYFIVFVLQQKPNPIYADLAVTKRKNRPIPPAPEDSVVVYAKLMEKEQADIFRQQLEQKPPPYDDVQISSTSSVTVIPPGIHGDRYVTTFKEEGTHVSINKVEERPQNVEETFDNQNPVSHRIPIPEDNQNDIPPPVQLVYSHKPVHGGHLLFLHQPHLLLLLLLTCPLPLK